MRAGPNTTIRALSPSASARLGQRRFGAHDVTGCDEAGGFGDQGEVVAVTHAYSFLIFHIARQHAQPDETAVAQASAPVEEIWLSSPRMRPPPEGEGKALKATPGGGSFFPLKAHVGQPVGAGLFARTAVVWVHRVVGTQGAVVVIVLCGVFTVVVGIAVAVCGAAGAMWACCCRYSRPAATVRKRAPWGSRSAVCARFCAQGSSATV